MRPIAFLIPPLLLISACAGAQSTSEVDRLRAENAELRRQLAAQQAAASGAGAPGAAAPASDGQAAAPAAPAAPLNLALPSGSAIPPLGTPAPTPAPAPTPPPGFRLIKEPDKYSDTGCSTGIFTSTADAGWKHEENWSALQRGDSPQTVEGVIGIDHYTVTSGTREVWQYGKCGTNVSGSVMFDKGAVVSWSAPDF